MRIALGQKRFVTGDFTTNLKTTSVAAHQAQAKGVDLLIFPELSLTGMVPAEEVPDIAIGRGHPDLRHLAELTRTGPSLVVGFVEQGKNQLFYNSQAYLEDGDIRAIQRKVYLPSYGAFDESRAFASGESYGAFDTKFGRAALLICEDAWHTALPYAAVADGATLLFTCAASPEGGTSADLSSEEMWTTVNRASAVTLKCFNFFTNMVGQDRHLNYWGGSHILSPSGKILARGSATEEELVTSDIDLNEIALQRHNFRYIQDERLELTIRELQRIGQRRWKTTRPDVTNDLD